jgi:branched-chain amino acid transport system substrate-binding protein
MNQFAAQGYDGLMLLLEAIKQAGTSDDRAAIKKAMDSITGYKPHIGQEAFRVSYSPTKHIGANGLCGLTLFEFGSNNQPKAKWSKFQPPC